VPDTRETIWVEGVRATARGMTPTEATMRRDMRRLIWRPLSVTRPIAE
jgi:hypothetical protein